MPQPHYRTMLLDEFAARRNRRQQYSLRAFARDLGVSVTCLSDVLASKRKFSKKNAVTVAERLVLSPSQTREFFRQIKSGEPETEDLGDYQVASEDTFKVVSDWYCLAILNLSKIPGCQSDPKWIAERLGISSVEAESAVARLVRLRFVKVSRGLLRRSSVPLQFGDGASSAAIRRYHRQNLLLAENAIEDEPLSRRLVTSVTMAVDPEKLSEATELITRFQKKLSRVLESGRPSEVYTMSLQLFPLTKQRGNT